jgi:hypothetical protein
VSRLYITDVEAVADFNVIAERWRAFCSDNAQNSDSEPIAILLLHALTDERTGDLVADVLSVMFVTMSGWRRVGEEGGGGVAMLDLYDVRRAERIFGVALELRRRERLVARSEPGSGSR